MNKKLATFASVAVLAAAASQANATVYDISGSFIVNGGGTTLPFSFDSGSYDTETGLGNWTATVDMSNLYTGSVSFDQTFTLDATTGLGTLNAATDCRPAPGEAPDSHKGTCKGLIPSFQGPITASLPIVDGINLWTIVTGSGPTDFTPTLTAQASEIPVPAAAWLFGSALLGLAGVGRRRTAA